MVDPTNGEVKIELGGEWGVVVLRYPLAALRELSSVLGRQVSVDELGSLLPALNGENLAEFVWAGLLQKARQDGADAPDLKSLREHIDWNLPPVPLFDAVVEAFTLSVYGETDDEEARLPKGKRRGPIRRVLPGSVGRALNASRLREWVSQLLSSGGNSPPPSS